MNDGGLTNCIHRAVEINDLIEHLPITPVIPLEKLVYGVSLHSIDQILSFERIEGSLSMSARGRLDLSVARVPMVNGVGKGMGITLGERWDRGFLGGIRKFAANSKEFPNGVESALGDLLLFHFELLSCVNAASSRPDQTSGEQTLWKEIQARVTQIWRTLYGSEAEGSFRVVELGRGEGEIWKALMAYYLPEIRNLMSLARAGSGPEDIRVHLLAVEGFEVRDFGGVFFERSLGNEWDPSRITVEFEGQTHEVKIVISDRIVGVSRFSEFIERIMALPEPVMRLKAFFSMIIEYEAFGGALGH